MAGSLILKPTLLYQVRSKALTDPGVQDFRLSLLPCSQYCFTLLPELTLLTHEAFLGGDSTPFINLCSFPFCTIPWTLSYRVFSTLLFSLYYPSFLIGRLEEGHNKISTYIFFKKRLTINNYEVEITNAWFRMNKNVSYSNVMQIGTLACDKIAEDSFMQRFKKYCISNNRAADVL